MTTMLLPIKGPCGDVTPVVVIDSREQEPLPIHRLPTVTNGLTTGDYSILGCENLFSVERKSIQDLVACCMGENRDRFERELHRLRGFRFKRLLIVGDKLDVSEHRYRSNLAPKAILSTLSAFEIRYDVPIVWLDTPELAANRLESWAWWVCREHLKTVTAMMASGVESKN